jgi:transcriptional regulator with PAS, ATPase and Fis domain
MLRVTLSDLSQVPVERLAQLLMEWALRDQKLLTRLHATIEENQGSSLDAADVRPQLETTDLIGQSAAVRHALDMIGRFARTEDPVLITGESGTGKELAARAIHDRSLRRDGPFLAVNCAALPATLVASELFGYEKGAFTGALARTKGQIEHANGGTLFLDEIGDMPVDLQGHLLRFLQDGQIVRVGGRGSLRVDVRIVAATNVRLREAIAEGRVREDLFYRLNVLALHLPPLRERREDIPLLAGYALRQATRQFGRDVSGFAPEAMDVLRQHHWPGNVRELMAVVRRAVVMGDSPVVRPADLSGLSEPSQTTTAGLPRPLPGSDQERAALIEALAGTQENITLTAQELGVSRVTLYRMLRRHSISLTRGLKAPPVAG